MRAGAEDRRTTVPSLAGPVQEMVLRRACEGSEEGPVLVRDLQGDGVSRSSLHQALKALVERELIRKVDEVALATGGRPATRVRATPLGRFVAAIHLLDARSFSRNECEGKRGVPLTVLAEIFCVIQERLVEREALEELLASIGGGRG